MKLVQHGDTYGALLGDTLVLVHGSSAFHLPATALASLRRVVSDLGTQDTPKPAATKVSATPATSAPKPTSKRRGRLWEAVAQQLQDAGRARGFASLLRFVKQRHLTDKDPTHALKIALGKKVSSGELILTSTGRYRLPEGAPEKAVQKAPPARKKKSAAGKKKQDISLGDYILSDLAEHPEGRSISALTELAVAGAWTRAKNPELAVKISVGRMSSQIAVGDDGLCRLKDGIADPDASASAPSGGVVRRRRGKVVSKR